MRKSGAVWKTAPGKRRAYFFFFAAVFFFAAFFAFFAIVPPEGPAPPDGNLGLSESCFTSRGLSLTPSYQM